MASETSICNASLIKVGEPTILTLDDDKKSARTLKEIYPEKRDTMLRSHLWKFAIKRTTLAPDVETPEFGFKAQFTLPTDNLRVLKVDISGERYKIEGNKLLCNLEAIPLLYIWRVEDANLMDPTFREALSSLLAREISFPICDSKDKYEKMDERYEDDIGLARMVGAMEDDLESIEADEWLWSRY